MGKRGGGEDTGFLNLRPSHGKGVSEKGRKNKRAGMKRERERGWK